MAAVNRCPACNGTRVKVPLPGREYAEEACEQCHGTGSRYWLYHSTRGPIRSEAQPLAAELRRFGVTGVYQRGKWTLYGGPERNIWALPIAEEE